MRRRPGPNVSALEELPNGKAVHTRRHKGDEGEPHRGPARPPFILPVLSRPSAEFHAVRIAGRTVEEPQNLDSVLRGHPLDAPSLVGVLIKDRQTAAPVRLTRRRGNAAAVV